MAKSTTDERQVADDVVEAHERWNWVDKGKAVFRSGGLSREVVKELSALKEEPSWMLDIRLEAWDHFVERPMPTWGPDLSFINFDKISGYVQPREDLTPAQDWEDVPEEMKQTFEKLGIPEAEQKILAGATAQYDSMAVYHRVQEQLADQGVLFFDMDTGLREHPEIVRKYFGTVIPYRDNKFAALNTALWSGGSFIYVPPGVRVEQPLQTYFRINSSGLLQAERTLIIADEGASVSYLEGCSAPTYAPKDSLHAAVVELIALDGAEINYMTSQAWPSSLTNLVVKRGIAGKSATIRWTQAEIGSGLNMKYPAVYLAGEGAHGEILSVAFANEGMNQDTGGKIIHMAPNTTSNIISKSISRTGGIASYRGLLEIGPEAAGSKSRVVCDALLLDEHSVSNTWPTIRVGTDDVDLGHEATVSKVGEEQIFYLMSHGISETEANAMVVNGFLEPVIKQMPMEYAVEINRLIDLEMEGSIG